MNPVDRDRRKFPRYPARFPFRYIHLLETGMNPGAVLPFGDRSGIVTGTSAQGISIATFRPFPAGETLGLIITLPFESESRTVSLSGKVVWSGQTRPDRFGAVSTSLSGIEFADCPNRSIIERFLEYWRRVAP